MKKLDKQKAVMLVLIVLLAIAVGYIGLGKFQERKQTEQLQVFQEGAQYGYEQAIMQLVQQATTCEPVPVFVQNQSINLIAVECLQAQQGSKE